MIAIRTYIHIPTYPAHELLAADLADLMWISLHTHTSITITLSHKSAFFKKLHALTNGYSFTIKSLFVLVHIDQIDG